VTLSLQEVSDRLEIQDLILTYAHAVDTRQWDLFEGVFTADASVDLSATGGPKGTVSEVRAALAEMLSLFRVTQHMVGPSLIRLDGDTATARTICHNPMVFAAEPDQQSGPQVWLLGIWYDDELVRTEDGWRIARRGLESSHVVQGLTNAPLA
jgi:hypothetical protein